MIDWLYQTGLDTSLLIGLVLLLRNPVRKTLGANNAYWLWLIPLVRIVAWDKTEVDSVILKKINFTDDTFLIKILQNPDNFQLSNYLSYEVFWLIGLIIWVLLRFLGFKVFRKNLIDSSVKTELKHLKIDFIEFKLFSKVNYFYTSNPSAPFITGLFNPCIYLPNESFDKLSKIQQICIIKHELTHLKRKDLWFQILAELIRTIFWFNPIVHIAWKAFRQDQELACDYQVLAKSNKLERYEYGRVLLKGIRAHALPATMAFFNNHKQRFIMLEKHNNSKINNILGITLCTVLLVFALTKAPHSIAKEKIHDQKISFKFDDTSLKLILKLIFEANPKKVIGYENVPKLNISFEAWDVSAIQLEKLILKCSGLKLIPVSNQFKIVKDSTFNNHNSEFNRCIKTLSNKEDVSQETKEAIQKRNVQFREYLKKHKMEAPEANTLPFEENETLNL